MKTETKTLERVPVQLLQTGDIFKIDQHSLMFMEPIQKIEDYAVEVVRKYYLAHSYKMQTTIDKRYVRRLFFEGGVANLYADAFVWKKKQRKSKSA